MKKYHVDIKLIFLLYNVQISIPQQTFIQQEYLVIRHNIRYLVSNFGGIDLAPYVRK